MALFHPGIPSCADCQRFVYEADRHGVVTGKRKQVAGRDWERPANVPPPCDKCPKESPEKESEHVLSDKNLQTLRLAVRVRATGGRCLSDREAADPVLGKNLADLAAILAAWEREQQARTLAAEIAPLLVR